MNVRIEIIWHFYFFSGFPCLTAWPSFWVPTPSQADEYLSICCVSVGWFSCGKPLWQEWFSEGRARYKIQHLNAEITIVINQTDRGSRYMILDRESPWSVSLIMTDVGVTSGAGRMAKDESMFTPEHLMLPGLYSEVMSDHMEADEGDTEDADNDADSCYCESCSSPSPNPSITPSSFELSCIYHRFMSSLRIAPVFRNFQVSV